MGCTLLKNPGKKFSFVKLEVENRQISIAGFLPSTEMIISWAEKFDSTFAGIGAFDSNVMDTICPDLGGKLAKYF